VCYLENKIVPLGNDVAEWTSMIRLTERHSAIHTPVQSNRQLGQKKLVSHPFD